MDKKIEAYVEQIVNGLHCSRTDKEDIKDELRDHLSLLKKEFLAEGMSEQEAAEKAVKCFGSQDLLIEGYRENLFPGSRPVYIGASVLFIIYSFSVLNILIFERLLVRMIHILRGETFNIYFWTPPNSNGYFDLDVWLWNANLVPFKNTIMYITEAERFNSNYVFDNTVGNIALFIPLGIFLPFLFKKYRKFSELAAAGILISFMVEAIQIILRIGQFDIDDIILNSLGAVIGYLLFKTIKFIYSSKFFHMMTLKLKWK